jgi:CRP/FNR family transcriptional regulator, nitrogen oxide reductase regulator
LAELKKAYPPACPELFEGLSVSDCRSILSGAPQKSFSVGQEIFRTGEPRETIHLLLEGLAKVSQVDRNGNEAILWLNVPGQILGSLNFVPGGMDSSSARAVQACKVVMWRLPVFESMLERFPLVLGNVERIIARQMSELSSRICEISTAPAWLCLGKALIRLTDQIGRKVNGHVLVELTQETLAQITGITVYNVNHQLSDWEVGGLVLRQRCTIVVRDLPGLKRMCTLQL